MALTQTTTIVEQTVFGNKRINIIKISCTEYEDAAGIPITAAICGLSILDYVIPFFIGDGVIAGNAAPISAWWDSTNSVLLLWKSSEAGCGAVNIASAGYVYAICIGS